MQQNKTPLRKIDDENLIRTPSNSIVNTLKRKEFLNKFAMQTFSPGFYACSKAEGDSDIFMSPQTQAELFPSDIDENSEHQKKYIDYLDSLVNDQNLQSQSEEYFKSNIIMPSPDIAMRNQSRMNPSYTPKGVKKNIIDNQSVYSVNVLTQTSLSIPLNFDLEACIRSHLKSNNESVTDDSSSLCEVKETSKVLFDSCDVFSSTAYRKSIENSSSQICFSCKMKPDNMKQSTARSLFCDDESDNNNRGMDGAPVISSKFSIRKIPPSPMSINFGGMPGTPSRIVPESNLLMKSFNRDLMNTNEDDGRSNPKESSHLYSQNSRFNDLDHKVYLDEIEGFCRTSPSRRDHPDFGDLSPIFLSPILPPKRSPREEEDHGYEREQEGVNEKINYSLMDME